MSPVAFKISNISKKYNKSENDSLFNIKSLLKKKNKQEKGFLALNNISLEINKGDFIGLIGKNGSGKSTLLKILSEITEPTSGSIERCGKVASVLDIGMGFHPELSGKENIFLSGALLGFTKKEILKILPEIIEFSGIAEFINTPVKHYSSGMYVRLAFSVVAHVDADILLFDEVLSIGDLEFQQKVIQKILSFQGKTIIMASHNISEISKLCNKVIYLQNGHLQSFGDTEDVLNLYISDSASPLKKCIDSNSDFQEILRKDFEKSESGNRIYLKSFFVQPSGGQIGDPLFTNQQIEFGIEFEKHDNHSILDIGILFSHLTGLFMVSHIMQSNIVCEKITATGNYIVKAQIEANLFNDTIIHVGLSFSEDNKTILLHENDLLTFRINKISEQNYADYTTRFPKFQGPLKPKLSWKVNFSN